MLRLFLINRRLRIGALSAAIGLALLIISRSGHAQGGDPINRLSSKVHTEAAPNAHSDEDSADRPSVSVPVFVDRQQEGVALVYPDPSSSRVLIEAEPVIAILQNYLPDSEIIKLRSGRDKQNLLTIDRLRSIAVKAVFSEAELNLTLVIPLEIRKQAGYVLRPEPEPGFRIGPAPYSGYLNLRASQNYQTIEGSATGSVREPTTGVAEIVQNWHGWVLDSSENYSEAPSTSTSSSFARGYSRIVHDEPGQLLRYTAGDLVLEVAGFQSIQNAGGVSVSRELSIQPYSTSRAVNRTQVFLNRPSTVEIYVNDGFVQRVQAPAGPLNLSDYPLVAGRNNVKLRLTNDVGQVEEINVSLLFDTQLVRQGSHQFYLSSGLVSTAVAADLTYENENSLISGFDRYGVSDRWTLGANFQRDRYRQLFGIESFHATELGTFIFDLAMSADGQSLSAQTAGQAARVQFRSPEYSGREVNRNTLSVIAARYLSQFAAPGTPLATPLYEWTLNPYWARRLTDNLRIGFGYQLNQPTPSARDTGLSNATQTIAQLDLSYRWRESWQFGCNVSSTHANVDDQRLYATLTWNDFSSKVLVQSTYDSSSSLSRLSVSRTPEKSYDDYRLDAAVESAPTENQFSAQAGYIGRRFEAGLYQISDFNFAGPKVHSTTLSLGSALIWTDSSIGVGRPINDSFAILHNTEPTKIELPVNGDADHPESVVGHWGPAVLPDLVSYYDKSILLKGSSLPEGYTLNHEFVIAQPTYKSGVDVALQVRATVAITGTLRRSKNQIGALLSGSLYQLTDAAGQPVASPLFTFFTTEQGVFFVEGLVAGRYRFVFNQTALHDLDFEIPDGRTGVLALGTLRVEE